MVPVKVFLDSTDSELHFGGFCSRVGPKLEAVEFLLRKAREAKNDTLGRVGGSPGSEKSKFFEKNFSLQNDWKWVGEGPGRCLRVC